MPDETNLDRTPHLASDFQNQPQLALLVVHGDLVPVVRAREAALRAET
jgi:hypothetical protein